LFVILIILHRKKAKNLTIIAIYFLGYGLIRFFLEFIKIDATPELLGLRWPQIISLVFIIGGGTMIYKSLNKNSHD
jgi:prolipoprotein diacylglyceryltransferase